MLRCVMFDWGGTLTDEHDLFRKIAEEFTYPFWKRLGFKGTLKDYMIAEKKTGEDLASSKRWKSQKREDWSLLFSKNTGVKISREGALKEFELFWDGYMKYSKLVPDAERILKFAKSKGLFLALVSNNWKESYKIFDKYRITKYFDIRVLSDEVGAFKSELKPFEYVLEKLNIKPNECLMVGDKIDEDGACRRLGIKFCLVDTKGEHHRQTKKFDYKISGLSKLEKIINVMCEQVK